MTSFRYTRPGRTSDSVSFLIRPARSQDTERLSANICAICAERVYLASDTFVLTEEWRHVLAHPVDEQAGSLLIVAEIDGPGGVVGHLRLFPPWNGPKSRHVGEIGMGILQPWRERGIGTAMLAYALEWARGAGFAKLEAEVFATNARALHLFQKFGFSAEAVRAREYLVEGAFVDEVCLCRFVEAPAHGG